MIKFLIIFLLWTNLCLAGTSHVVAGITSTSVVSADTQRTVIIIKNIGLNNCKVTEEATADVDGYDLAPGDVYTATERHAKPALSGITNTGTTTLSIWERKE